MAPVGSPWLGSLGALDVLVILGHASLFFLLGTEQIMQSLGFLSWRFWYAHGFLTWRFRWDLKRRCKALAFELVMAGQGTPSWLDCWELDNCTPGFGRR